MDSKRKQELLDYVAEMGATNEDLEAAGFTEQEIEEAFASLPEPEQLPHSARAEQPANPESLEAYEPTRRENWRVGLQEKLKGFGLDEYLSQDIAQTVMGNPNSTKDLGTGLIDFTPMGIVPSVEEGVDTARRGINSGDILTTGLGGLEAGLGILEATPVTKLAGKAVRSLAKTASESFDPDTLYALLAPKVPRYKSKAPPPPAGKLPPLVLEKKDMLFGGDIPVPKDFRELFNGDQNELRYKLISDLEKSEEEVTPFLKKFLDDLGLPINEENLDYVDQLSFKETYAWDPKKKRWVDTYEYPQTTWNAAGDLPPSTVFRSAVKEIVDTIEIPKKGIKGSVFLKELQDNPSVRMSEWKSLGIEIDPQKTYSREELTNLLGDNLWDVEVSNRGSRYSQYQRQDTVGLKDPETDYAELTVDAISNKAFKPNRQHYDQGTLAHTRVSTREDANTNQKYLLVEELQSDLIQGGTQGVNSSVDRFIDQLLDHDDKPFPSYFNLRRAILKNISDNNLRKDVDLVLSGLSFEYSQIRGEFLLSGESPTLKSFLETDLPDSSQDIYFKAKNYYEPFREDFEKFKKSLPKEVTPPINSLTESVRITFDALVDYANKKGLDKIVFPPFEKIVEARFGSDLVSVEKALDEKSGFYATYIKALSKVLKEFKDEFGDAVSVSGKQMNYKSKPSADDPKLAEKFRVIVNRLARDIPYYRQSPQDFAQQYPNTFNSFLRDIRELDEIFGIDLNNLPFNLRHEEISNWLEKEWAKNLSKKQPSEFLGIEVDISKLLKEYDTSKPRFAKGGMVIDPISKNPVPLGATSKEVRDDVDIKASEGEYIIPADVVRYLGLDKIEKLILKAKEGIAELGAKGRIGGKTDEDLPFDDAELLSEDVPEDVPQMAEGGMVASPQEDDPFWWMKNQSQNGETPAYRPEKKSEGDRIPSKPGMYEGNPNQWSVDALTGFPEHRTNIGNRLAEQAVMTFGPMGVGNLMMKHRNNYLDKNIPTVIENMLRTGVDNQGNPLDEAQKEALQRSLDAVRNGEKYKPGIKGLIREQIGGMFGGLDRKPTSMKPSEGYSRTRVSPTRDNSSGSDRPQAGSTSQSFSKDKPKMSGGGLVSRRKK